MNEKFNKNSKVEQLTNMFYAVGKKKALSLKILWLLSNKKHVKMSNANIP